MILYRWLLLQIFITLRQTNNNVERNKQKQQQQKKYMYIGIWHVATKKKCRHWLLPDSRKLGRKIFFLIKLSLAGKNSFFVFCFSFVK